LELDVAGAMPTPVVVAVVQATHSLEASAAVGVVMAAQGRMALCSTATALNTTVVAVVRLLAAHGSTRLFLAMAVALAQDFPAPVSHDLAAVGLAEASW
jgi:hypothetical protein